MPLSTCASRRRSAAPVSSSKRSVTPLMAETMTTGGKPELSRAAFTIPTTRAIASASATEVPPNFITIGPESVTSGLSPSADARNLRTPVWCSYSSSGFPESGGQTFVLDSYSVHLKVVRSWLVAHQQTVGPHQFRIQHGCTRGAANRIVSERDELHVEDRTRTHATDRDRHAAVTLRIESRLRTICGGEPDDRVGRGRRQSQLLRPAAERLQRGNHVGDRRPTVERDRNALGVSVNHGHTRRLCADDDRVRRDAVAVQRAENLLSLALHLFFLARDGRHDVAENVERCHAR